MTKSRLFLFIIIVSATVGMYMLPRYVVSNDSPSIDVEENVPEQLLPAGMEGMHVFQIPDSLAPVFESLYVSFSNAENQEKRFIFADSLAMAYKNVGKLDSAAKYFEQRALSDPSFENLVIAGDAYYEAFNFAVEPSKRTYLADKAQEYFNRVLDEDPLLFNVKAKLAMTYVTGQEPMRGIMMLREVLDSDPGNEMAIYNLGILAITSGQLDKAIERFDELLALNPENPEANFYMGYCLFESGRKEQSRYYFNKLIEINDTGDLAIASKDYLKNINN